MSEPAYLKAFKELIKSEPTFIDLPRMELEFYGESPRAVILLSATLVELALETALKYILRPGKETEALFDFEAPLGTFSGKIKLSYAIKLFGNKTLHDFELIRHLRNGFAHSRHPLTFDTPQVASLCKHFLLPDEDTPLFHTRGPFSSKIPSAYLARATKAEDAQDLSHPRTRYVATCNMMAVTLITFGKPVAGSAALSPPLLP